MALQYSNGQESNDWSEWDNTLFVESTLTLSAPGLNSSSYKIDGAIDSTPTDRVDMDMANYLPIGGTVRFGLRLKTSSLSYGTYPRVDYGRIDKSGGSIICAFYLKPSGGNHIIGARLWDDSTSTFLDGSTTFADGAEITFEVMIIRSSDAATSDGEYRIYLNGVQDATWLNRINATIYDELFSGASGNHYIDTPSPGGSGSGASGTISYDDISFRDDGDSIFNGAVAEFRFLGFAADTGTLMVSGLKSGGTLQLFDYDLDTLTESGTTSFGSATDADLDSRTRGIFPMAKPMEDDVWYLYGRDGNNVQVQYNDRSGTAGWVDLSPGTASWGSTKYAVGLFPSSTDSQNVIVAFSDDDVWRTRFGTTSWVQMGDADTGDLRTGARMIANRSNELILAGASAGSVLYSPNSGVAYDDVSGTALGTINAIEVSL